jgi:cytochrome P450
MAQKLRASLTAHLLKDPLHPFPYYQVMREQRPVYYSSEFKSWFVSRYDDVQCVIDDPELFSSQQTFRRRRSPSEEGKTVRTLLWADPPHHRQLRSLVSQAFTPRTISGLATRITQIAHTHLDIVAAQGTMDIINDLANPLPIIVIAELLGIPTQDQQQFKRWSDSIVSPAHLEKKQAVIAMNAYFLKIIAQRRQQQQDDLISALLTAQLDGAWLSDAELLNFCRLLLVAGHETSTNLIGNALLTLDEQPEVMDELRAAPDLIPAAVEEVIRYRTPIQRLRRAATSDTNMRGYTIKAGEIVSPILGSANRDAEQFSQPDTFDIHRTPNRHLGFGHGIHFCIGAPLARLEAKIALETLLTRFTAIKLCKEFPLQPVASSFVYGVKNLPVTFREVL